MYTFKSRVRYSEIDENGLLDITSVINYMQDCSTFLSEDVGLGIEFLKKQERAWLLSSWQIVFDRYPLLGEEIIVGTWAYDFKGMYGYRNFVLQDQYGNFLVRANSIWFFMNTKTGKPVRVTMNDIRGYNQEDKLSMDYASRKIKLPSQWETGEAIMVRKHHIDTNHHVNNGQYVAIARECIPEDFKIGELRAEYKKAAVYGDIMIPLLNRHESGYTVVLQDLEGEVYTVVELCRQMERD